MAFNAKCQQIVNDGQVAKQVQISNGDAFENFNLHAGVFDIVFKTFEGDAIEPGFFPTVWVNGPTM